MLTQYYRQLKKEMLPGLPFGNPGGFLILCALFALVSISGSSFAASLDDAVDVVKTSQPVKTASAETGTPDTLTTAPLSG
ncbi:MAG: hypothetical protein JNK33_06535, partial [Candidatus Doudnabacteria bacterium]|nr:hypothetical protein [Candidatus Doudnabacteria bacterium]